MLEHEQLEFNENDRHMSHSKAYWKQGLFELRKCFNFKQTSVKIEYSCEVNMIETLENL